MKRFIALFCALGAVLPFAADALNLSLFGGWFPAWSRFISAQLAGITAIVPFVLAEVLLIAAVIAVPAYWIISYGKTRSFWRAPKHYAVCACVLAFSFMWLWGINYLCPQPSESMGIVPAPASTEELVSAAVFYRDALNAMGNVPERNFEQMADAVVNGYNTLSVKYDFIRPNPQRPKRPMLGVVQSYLGVSGIYVPWTAECCVVGDTPLPNLPATMAHELAHRQGAAHEDEASFIGILACLESGDEFVKYSGMFYAFIHLSNAVYKHDKTAHEELWSGLSDKVYTDLTGVSRHYEKYEGPVSDAGTAVNDVYLQAMQQPEGVESYGMVVDLLIAYNKKIA